MHEEILEIYSIIIIHHLITIIPEPEVKTMYTTYKIEVPVDVAFEV